MTAQSPNGRRDRDHLPALLGTLTQDHEEKRWAGGSGPKKFVPPAEVRGVFGDGIRRLEARVRSAGQRYKMQAAVAVVKLRTRGSSKSNLYSTLFERMPVAGVQGPGELLTLATPRNLNALAELLDRATQTQFRELSSVERVTPYAPSIEKGQTKSFITLFDGQLDDGSSLAAAGVSAITSRGAVLRQYGKLPNRYTSQNLPEEIDLREMPWVRGVQPIARMQAHELIGRQPISVRNLSEWTGPLPTPIVGIVDTGIDTTIPYLARLVVA